MFYVGLVIKMSENNWYQVDNVAKVFLATCNNRDTRTLRVSCTLNEDIDPEVLQQAAVMTAEERPQFQVRIRRGIFWHYMEETDLLPVVAEETRRVCPRLYEPGRANCLHYEITYFGNRINLDLFHAISDGTGALEFLNILVFHYLTLKYPELPEDLAVSSGASADDLSEDSYKHFYNKKGHAQEALKKALHPKGLMLPYDQLQFFELQMPVADILPKAKEIGVSLTSYLGARLMLALSNDMPTLSKGKPVNVSMPVNLRNYYPSSTSRNFFNNVNVTHIFTEDISLEDLAREFDASLKADLDPDKIKAQMDNYEKMEALAPVKMVPLFVKQFTVRTAVKASDENVSIVLSNLGVQRPAEELRPYIQNYSAFCSSKNLFVAVSSYGDTLTLGITSPYSNTGVLKNFVRGLTDDDIKVKAYATEVVR